MLVSLLKLIQSDSYNIRKEKILKENIDEFPPLVIGCGNRWEKKVAKIHE